MPSRPCSIVKRDRGRCRVVVETDHVVDKGERIRLPYRKAYLYSVSILNEKASV